MAKKAGRWYVTVTYVQYLTGAAAVQAAKEDGVIQSDAEAELVENMYLRPQGSRVDVLPVATHVSVFLLVADAQGSLPTDSDGKVKHTRVPIERFAALSNGSAATIVNWYVNNPEGPAGIVYELAITNGKVTAIRQVYTP